MVIQPKQRKPIIIISLFLVICLGWLLAWCGSIFSSVVKDPAGVKYIVSTHATMADVEHDLSQLQIIQSPKFFSLLIHLKGAEHALKSGEYLFPKGTTPWSLLRQITTGSGLVYHPFMIIPGWTFSQVRHALDADENLTHTTTHLTDEEIMAQLGRPKLKPEGLFYPDTYFFLKDATDISVLKRAYNRMQTKLMAAWKDHDKNAPYHSMYDALIVASLVEKEAKIDKDRPLIAGVIINRLKKNMLLQIDPTVIYGMGTRYQGTIHHADLIAHTPYNTYVIKGLPPTPIAMPGMSAINAAMHPPQHDFLYFVARDGGDGSHQFSATLAEHNQAVVKAREGKFPMTFFNRQLVQRYLLNAVKF